MGIVQILRILPGIIGKILTSADLLIQPCQLLLKGRPVFPRPHRFQTVLHLPGRLHSLRGLESLLQSVQLVVGLVRHPRQHILPRGRTAGHSGPVQAPPGLIPHHAVHSQVVLALVVQHRVIGVAAEYAVLIQAVAVPVQLLLQIQHRTARVSSPKLCCHSRPLFHFHLAFTW